MLPDLKLARHGQPALDVPPDDGVLKLHIHGQRLACEKRYEGLPARAYGVINTRVMWALCSSPWKNVPIQGITTLAALLEASHHSPQRLVQLAMEGCEVLLAQHGPDHCTLTAHSPQLLVQLAMQKGEVLLAQHGPCRGRQVEQQLGRVVDLQQSVEGLGIGLLVQRVSFAVQCRGSVGWMVHWALVG